MITAPLSFLVTICAFTDLRTQKIPNVITLPGAMLAICLHAYHAGIQGFYLSLGGWVLGFALLILPYSLNAMGAGDVKLLAAIGAVVGPQGVFVIFLYAALIGGAYALLHRLIAREGFHFSGELFQTVKHFLLFRKFLKVQNKSTKKTSPLCYGMAIAAGTYIYIGETLELYRIIG
jgi:prepilin peptidase CpaA